MMKEGYKMLGNFIRQVDVRNTEGKEENLLGVSVQKNLYPRLPIQLEQISQNTKW